MIYVIFDDCVTLLPTLNIKILFSAILSVISDNAANMVCLVRLLNVLLKADVERFNDNNDDLEIFQDGDDFLLQVDGIAKLMNHDLGIISGRCAAHGLQLSIKKGYAASDLTEVLTRVRTIATSLRTPSIAALLRKNHQKKVISDNNTRWSKLVRTKYKWFVC